MSRVAPPPRPSNGASKWVNPLGSTSSRDESTDNPRRPHQSHPAESSSGYPLPAHPDHPKSHSPIKKRSVSTSLRSVSGGKGFPSVTDSYRPNSSTPSISPEKHLEELPNRPLIRGGEVGPNRDWREVHGTTHESERRGDGHGTQRRMPSSGRGERNDGYHEAGSSQGLEYRGSSSRRRDGERYVEEGKGKGRDDQLEGRDYPRSHNDASRVERKRPREEDDWHDGSRYDRNGNRSPAYEDPRYDSRSGRNDGAEDRHRHGTRSDRYRPSSQQDEPRDHGYSHKYSERDDWDSRYRAGAPIERSKTTGEYAAVEGHRSNRQEVQRRDQGAENRGRYGGGDSYRPHEERREGDFTLKDSRGREDWEERVRSSSGTDQAGRTGYKKEYPAWAGDAVQSSNGGRKHEDEIRAHPERHGAKRSHTGDRSYTELDKFHSGIRQDSDRRDRHDHSNAPEERVRRDSWKPDNGESSSHLVKSPNRSHKRRISSESREEGELGETDPVVETRPSQPPSPVESPPKSSPRKSAPSDYKPIIIKNRPTRVQNPYRATTPPEPPQPQEDIPPPPSPTGFPPPPPLNDAPPSPYDIPPSPMDEPPPPPDASPPPPPSAPTTDHLNPITPHQPSPPDISVTDLSQTSIVENVEPPPRPKNRQLEAIRSHGRNDVAPPSAPNPNLLNPPTRPSTPVKIDRSPSRQDIPRKFVRPTMDEEMKRYGKTFKGCSTMDAYETGVKLGEGTFGVVTKGTEIGTKRAVALKKLIMHNQRDGVSLTTKREIQILKALDHKNVVPLLDMIVHPEEGKSGSTTHRNEIFMVFPFMDHDLCGLLTNKDFKVTVSRTKFFMKQLLEGMAYIHSKGCVHRDIKTANILVDRRGGIMIADFGLARYWKQGGKLPNHSADELTNMVVTRWYRAPELFLGETRYGPAIDIWSIGCVMGELFKRSPILQGATDPGQLELIIEKCGPLNDETMPGWRQLPGVPGQETRNWDNIRREKTITAWAKTYSMDGEAADLLSQLLTLDPNNRPTAIELLDHFWFWTKPFSLTSKNADITVECSHEMNTRPEDWHPGTPTSADFRPPPPLPVRRNRPPMRGGGARDAPAWGRPAPQGQLPPLVNQNNVRPGQNNMNAGNMGLHRDQPHPNLQAAQNGRNPQTANQVNGIGRPPQIPYNHQQPYQNNQANQSYNNQQHNTQYQPASNGYHNNNNNQGHNGRSLQHLPYHPANQQGSSLAHLPFHPANFQNQASNQSRAHVPAAPFMLSSKSGPAQGQSRFPANTHAPPPPPGITLAGASRSRTMPGGNGLGEGRKRSPPRDAPTGPSSVRGDGAKRPRTDLEEGEELELDYGS